MGAMKDFIADKAVQLAEVMRNMPLHQQQSILSEFYEARDWEEFMPEADEDWFTYENLAEYCLTESDNLDDDDIDAFLYYAEKESSSRFLSRMKQRAENATTEAEKQWALSWTKWVETENELNKLTNVATKGEAV